MTTTTSETFRESALSGKTAVYLYSRAKLQNNINNMFSAFSSEYKSFMMGYSFKTNYLKDICLTALKSGLMAEVVSPEEYIYARELGFPDSRIIYNGVIDDCAGKAFSASCGGIINVDSLRELAKIESFARNNKLYIKLGIRCNFDIGNDLLSRYGIDIHSEDFRAAMEIISKSKNIKLGGFHCHIGFSRPKRYWKSKIETMIALVKSYGGSYIDLGGGMFGEMPPKLSTQFSDYVSSYNEYAEILCREMKRAFPEEDVMLIIEPGTALVGNVMDVKGTVVDIKQIRGHAFVTMNCNSNQLGIICEYKNVPTEIIHNHKGEEIDIAHGTIGGNTCLDYDHIIKDFSGRIAVGDNIVFKNVGAYSLSMGRQFIVPRLGVVEKDTGEVMRMSESYKDMYYEYFNT